MCVPPLPPTRAAAYLYADEGALTVPDIAWPEWTADRPAAGSLVPRFRPLATVSADAATPTAAEAALHERMGRLAQLLYRGQKTGKEMPL